MPLVIDGGTLAAVATVLFLLCFIVVLLCEAKLENIDPFAEELLCRYQGQLSRRSRDSRSWRLLERFVEGTPDTVHAYPLAVDDAAPVSARAGSSSPRLGGRPRRTI